MTDVAVRQQTALSITPGQTEFNEAQVATLTQLGVVNADRANLAVFFHQSTRTGLDPFAKQIYMIARQVKERVRDESGRWVDKYVTKFTIQTGIDGYRLIARRAADKARVPLSVEDTLWCGPDGQWVDAWVAEYPPTAAKVTVWRGDERFSHVSLWREYVQTYYNRDAGEHVPNSMWQKMPANQLAKTAEAGALRKAFPLDLSGLYTDEEMPPAEPGEDVVDEAPQTVRRRRPVRTQAAEQTQVEEPPAADLEPSDDVVEQPPAEDAPEPQEAAQPPMEDAQTDDNQAAQDAFTQGLDAEPVAPAPQAGTATDTQPASAQRCRKLTALLKPNFAGPEPAAAWMSEKIGRQVTSTADLTVIECEQLITELTQ